MTHVATSDVTSDPSFFALVDDLTACTDGGADTLIEALHRAAWKFSLDYSPFRLPYRSGNPVDPLVKGKVEDVARFLMNAFRSRWPLGQLTRSQLERLDSSLLLMQPGFDTAGFRVQAAIKSELEDLEASYDMSLLLSQLPSELATMTLEQLNEHKSRLMRSGDRAFTASVQAAIDRQSHLGA